MDQLLFNYWAVILEFLFELGVFCALCCARLTRRPNFWGRLAASVGALLLVCLAVAGFYTAFGDTVPGRILVYVLLFLLALGVGLTVFDEPVWTVLFCVSAAYAAQNLVYKLYLIQYFFGKLLGIYSFPDTAMGKVEYRVMYYTVFALLSAVVYFLFIRRMRDKLTRDKLNSAVLTVAVIILAVSVILCSIEDILFERAGMSVLVGTAQPTLLFALRQASSAVSAVCGVAILLFLSRTLEKRNLQREVEQLQHTIRQSEQQYKISRDTVDMINIKCHDMKYKLDAAILGSGVSADAFADLRRSIAIYDSVIETGNPLLDVLFTEKSLYCESHGITLSCMVDGKLLSFIEDGDLYCMFGNIVDNALEAVMGIREREKRVINVVVKGREGMALVQVENYFTGLLRGEDGQPVTTKDDKNYHGFGLRSIRAIARKYGGEMSVDAQGDVFSLTLLFPTVE